MRRIGQVKVGEEVVGHRTKVKVVKNKLAPPFQIAEFDIRYGLRIDAAADLLDLAVTHEVIEKNGSYLSFAGQSLGQGREKARVQLIEDADLRSRVQAAVTAATTAAAKSGKRLPVDLAEAEA